jgi:hypothetical protein
LPLTCPALSFRRAALRQLTDVFKSFLYLPVIMLGGQLHAGTLEADVVFYFDLLIKVVVPKF